MAIVMERLLPHAFLVANDPDSVNRFHHSISRRIGNYHLESRLTNQASLLAYKFNFNSNSAKICLFKNFWAIVKIFFRLNKGIKLSKIEHYLYPPRDFVQYCRMIFRLWHEHPRRVDIRK